MSAQYQLKQQQKCVHSNFGGIFEEDTISCETEVLYGAANTADAEDFKQTALNLLRHQGVKDESSRHDDYYSSDFFHYEGLGCSIGYTPAQTGTVTVTLGCGGAARKDYFPVSSD